MLRGSGVALGGEVAGASEDIGGGADNLDTAKCAFTSKPVKALVFLVDEKEVLRVSKENGIRKEASSRV